MNHRLRPRAWRAILVRGIAYFAAWMVMAGGQLAAVAPGLAAAGLATWISTVLLPPNPGFARPRPLAVLRLAVRFVWSSVVAGLGIACRAFSPSLPLKPGYVTDPAVLRPGTARNLFRSVTSLMPGALPAGTDEGGGLICHCLDVDQPVVRELEQEESRLVATLGAATGDSNDMSQGDERGVLVKGALFLSVGVIAASGAGRRAVVLVPSMLLCLGLGGLPFTSGAIAKYSLKAQLDVGVVGWLAAALAVGTTLLMLHFFSRLASFGSEDPQATASRGLSLPWLPMAVAALALP